MKTVKKYLLTLTGFAFGYGLGDVLQGNDFNKYALCIVLFLLLIILTITIVSNDDDF